MTDAALERVLPRRGVKWVFIGPCGLRTVWGVLAFIALVGVLANGSEFVLERLHIMPEQSFVVVRLIPTLAVKILGVAILAVATVIAALIGRRTRGQLGFGLTNAVARFFQGLAVGTGVMVALFGALYGCHALVIDSIALRGSDAFAYSAQWGLVFLFVGLSEEMNFRGYLQQIIARGLNFRLASVTTGVVFVAAHVGNRGETLLGFLSILAFGLVMSFSVWRTGAIWWAVGYHAAWDWVQTFVFGTADSGRSASNALLVSHPAGPAWLSGGTAGPEGSVLALVALALSAGIVMTIAKPDEVLDVRF